jgi:hypothetical protein
MREEVFPQIKPSLIVFFPVITLFNCSTGTVVVRLLMFPLVILAQKNTAATHNHMPVIQKMQEKFTKARQSGNPIEGLYIDWFQALSIVVKSTLLKSGF